MSGVSLYSGVQVEQARGQGSVQATSVDRQTDTTENITFTGPLAAGCNNDDPTGKERK